MNIVENISHTPSSDTLATMSNCGTPIITIHNDSVSVLNNDPVSMSNNDPVSMLNTVDDFINALNTVDDKTPLVNMTERRSYSTISLSSDDNKISSKNNNECNDINKKKCLQYCCLM